MRCSVLSAGMVLRQVFYESLLPYLNMKSLAGQRSLIWAESSLIGAQKSLTLTQSSLIRAQSSRH